MKNSKTVSLGKEDYSEIEEIISKIAEDHKIDNVESIRIHLSKEDGVARFVVSAFGAYSSAVVEAVNKLETIITNIESSTESVTEPAVKYVKDKVDELLNVLNNKLKFNSPKTQNTERPELNGDDLILKNEK